MQNPTKEKVIIDMPMFMENDNTYNLVLHNDDVTPLDYVVAVLLTIFEKNERRSFELMMQAQTEGSAIIDTVDYNSGKAKLDALALLNMLAGFDLAVTMTQN